MEAPSPHLHLQLMSLPLMLLLLCVPLPFSLSYPFSPLDNYLLNCGSTSNATLDNRVFVPDSLFLSTGRSISLSEPNPPRDSLAIYDSARVFTAPLTYKFTSRTNGTHLVRFHFWPFKGQGFDLSQAKFSVFVNGFMVLSEFSTQVGLVKEFVASLDSGETEVVFEPIGGKSGLGFVSAIELFSAPKDFIVDKGARLVGANGIGEFPNLSTSVLETLHRINVGGPKLTPFNDTLWRTWIPDDDYLILKSAAKRVVSSHSPNYQTGGATREIAPDNVYMTAKEMNRNNGTVGILFNVSWSFPVGLRRARYLVRLHFCDIVSTALNQLYFDVYINDFEAYRDVDLSSLTFDVLASPVFEDFVVDSDDAGTMRVSVGPSILSSPVRVNAILNGLEIMRMLSLTGSQEEGSGKRKIWPVVASGVGGGVILLLAIFVIVLVCKRRKKKTPKPRRTESTGWTPLRVFVGSSDNKLSEGTAITSPGTNGYQRLKIPLADVLSATNNFDESFVIGQGGFGMVYKGILKDNTKIAIKRGVPGSRQGLPEFQTEISVLSRIRHRHLVSLVGYCEEQSEMILVYEYMDKGPLKNHLYGSGNPPLSWKQRLEICICAARGIHYLHTGSTQGIIHRDIKSTNILLDANYVAKVADFGLSRSGPCLDESHVSTGVKGSFGYLDPEYFRRQQLTDKSDVYSFGVLLLEVLCARPAVDPLLTREQVNLAEWAMQWQKKGMLDHIIDPHLAGQIKPSSLKKFGETAEKCLAEYGVDRPTMGDVLWNLEYILQLQESGPINQLNEEGNNGGSRGQSETAPQASSSNAGRGRAGAIESSDISTTHAVFSQLITNEGR